MRSERSRIGQIQPSRPRLLMGLMLGFVLATAPGPALAAEEAEGIAALGLNLPGLIAQLVNFTILLVLLRMFLWKPILKMLDERKRRIEEGLERSEAAASQAEASEAEARQVIEAARVEARETTTRAQEAAARLRDELETQARADAEQIVTRARDEIRLEREQAIVELRSEFADLTIRAAERVVGQSLDREAHARLIDEVLVEGNLGGDRAN